MTAPARTARFTGYHMAAIMIAFFSVVIVVNVAMARFAITTFGGVVVENSYVASQHFNRWLDEAARERALGWSAEAQRREDGRIAVTEKGTGQADLVVTATARHPLGRMPDQKLSFTRDASGTFVSGSSLPAGRWQLRIEMQAGKKTWRGEQAIL